MSVEPASAGQEPPREPIHKESLGRNVTIVGGAALASRIAGFVRDMLIAAMLGAGAVADAYVAAFLIPNLFRRLIGEGAFNAAYVPIFTRRRAEGGQESAASFAGAALSLLVALGLLILLAAEFAMPAIIAIVAPGFVDDARKFADAVAFGRILFPFVAVVLVAALFTGTLNAIGRYAVAAATPLILNLLLIAALLTAMAAGLGTGREAGFVLAWTLLAAGCLNLLIVAVATWRAGWRIRPTWPRLDPDIRRLMLIAMPGIAIIGSGPVNIVIAAQLSSGTPSAMAWLYFADRIFELPLGFVVASVGAVLLPAVARHLASGDVEAASAAESRALEFGLLITLPAAIALALLTQPIVSILYERGAFTAKDSEAVAAMLRALAFGLPAFALVKVFLPAFLAREDLKSPILAAGLGIAANIAVTLALIPQIGPVAAAIGVTASATVNALALGVMLLRRGLFRPDALALKRLPRVLLASALTGLAVLLLADWLGPRLDGNNAPLVRIMVLGFICCSGVLIQFGLAYALKAVDFPRIRGLKRR